MQVFPTDINIRQVILSLYTANLDLAIKALEAGTNNTIDVFTIL